MKQYQVSASEKKFVGSHLLVAILALAVGSLFGPLQSFEHAGWDFYPYLKPLIKSYYQGLTVHGVLNALVWTTFFIMGFLTFNVTFGLKRALRNPTLNKVGFWCGLALIAAFAFYWKMSRPIGIAMLLVFIAFGLITEVLYRAMGPSNLLWIALGIFVFAWIGQFIGHVIEGARPSFFTDLAYLLIGPAWLAGKQQIGMVPNLKIGRAQV